MSLPFRSLVPLMTGQTLILGVFQSVTSGARLAVETVPVIDVRPGLNKNSSVEA